MASTDEGPPPRTSEEFVESSVLEAIVPASSRLDIHRVLSTLSDGATEDPNSSVLPGITQRQYLFFDEKVQVYVILRTPQLDQNTLDSYLSRLAISLDAYVVSSAPPAGEDHNARAQPPKELLYSESIQDTYKPELITWAPDGAAPGASHNFVIWKLDVFLPRPRQRLPKAAVYFTPGASLKPPEKIQSDVVEEEYLPSHVPTAINLLQSFSNDPGLNGVQPRLSALRVTKVAPNAPVAKELMRPIRNGPRRLFRAAPAILWRVRYLKWKPTETETSILALLDLEASSFAGCRVSINDVQMVLHRGRVEAMHGPDGIDFPLILKPGDHTTLIYKLSPLSVDEKALPSIQSSYPSEVRLLAHALVAEDCTADLAVEWRSTVDFAGPSELGRNRASSQLRVSTGSDLQLATAPGPDFFVSQRDSIRAHFPDETTFSLTISGPDQVRVGQVFQWDLFIVNRSEQPRRLSITLLPRRKRAESRHKTNPSTGSIDARREDEVANAVVDDNIVYAKQKNARHEPAELVCLSTDIRIGPLAPLACYTAEIKLLALSPGVLSADVLRVVDLGTQEATDIRDLPSVVVLGQ